MGTIKDKDQALAMGVLSASKGNPKANNLKLPEKKKPENPNPVMGVRILPRRRTRKGKRRPNAPITIRDGIQKAHA